MSDAVADFISLQEKQDRLAMSISIPDHYAGVRFASVAN